MTFIDGLNKTAALSEDETHQALGAATLDHLPLGTTLSSTFGDRPRGHSRLAEWGTRIVLPSALATGALGLVRASDADTKYFTNANSKHIRSAAHHIKKDIVNLRNSAAPYAAIAASIGGAILANKIINRKYYEDGKLKPEYRK